MTRERTVQNQEEEEKKRCIGYGLRVERPLPLPWKGNAANRNRNATLGYLSEHVCDSAHALVAPLSDNGIL